MNSRKQFEAWIKPLWHLETFEGSDDSLQYRDEVIQGKWEAWQAAFKASEQQLEESRREFTAANATIHNLELKVEQVVAENAGLKTACVPVFEAGYNRGHLNTIDGISGCGDYEQDAFEVLAENIETPATDAYLAEVRAQGVDVAIEQLHKKFEGTGHIGVPVMVLESFAAQLRQGAEHE